MDYTVITTEMLWSNLWKGFMTFINIIVTSPSILGTIAILVAIVILSRALDKKKKKNKQ